MTIITGPAWYCPQPDVHICTAGAAWSATVIPSDEYSGLASPAEGVWVATGKGRAGTTPTDTAISVDNGSNWAPGGQIANLGNTTPFFLTAGNGRLVALHGSKAVITLDQGANWTHSAGIVTSNCVGLQFGNAQFVFVDGIASAVYTTADGLSFATFVTPAKFAAVFWDAYRARWLCFEGGAGVRTWSTPDFVTFTLQGNLGLAGGDIGNDGVAQSDSGVIVIVHQGAATAGERSLDGGATWIATGTFGASQNTSVLWGNGGFLVNQSLGSANVRSNNDGATFSPASAQTLTKTWFRRWDGLNTYVAVGTKGTVDTVANIGGC